MGVCKSTTKKKDKTIQINPEIQQELQKENPFDQISNPKNLSGKFLPNWEKIKDDNHPEKQYYYQGEWQHSHPHGAGRAFEKNQSLITYCFFQAGFPQLQSCLTFNKSREKYVGSLNQNREMHGQGHWRGQQKNYKGEFQNGKFSGIGILVTKSAMMIGKFEDNKFIQGCKKEGDKTFQGRFVNGELEGNGLQIWKDGGKYIGQFKEGLKGGKGVLFDRQGQLVRKGEWVQDNFLGQEFGPFKASTILEV